MGWRHWVGWSHGVVRVPVKLVAERFPVFRIFARESRLVFGEVQMLVAPVGAEAIRLTLGGALN